MNSINKRLQWLIPVAVLLLACSAISSYSLWMDESMRIEFSQVSVEDGYFTYCWSFMQVGLVHLFYLWGEIFGKSEIAYRLFNLPFLFIATAYLIKILRKHNLSPWWILLMVIHPLIFYYLNDAGPYVALMACAAAMGYHCFYSEKRDSLLNTVVIFAWLVFGFSLHFVFGFVGVLYLYAVVRRIQRERSVAFLVKEVLVVLPFAAAILYLAYMYLGNMPHGEAKGWDAPGIKNIAYAVYCFLGFGGLGLPRNDVRMGSLQLITVDMIVLSVLHVGCFVGLLILNIRALWKKINIPLIWATLMLALVFYVASVTRNFQFVERHVIFLFPAVFLFLVFLYYCAWNNPRHVLNRTMVVLSIILLVTSSIRTRCLYDYQKDDNKGMITYLRDNNLLDGTIPVLAQGKWHDYKYYNVHLVSPSLSLNDNSVMLLNSPSAEHVQEITRRVLQSYSSVCLVLSEKEKATQNLYVNAEQIFRELGYRVKSVGAYNTYKILVLSH